MQSDLKHDWDLTPEQAIALQKKLAAKVRLQDQPGNIEFVAGIDVGFPDKGRSTRAAICVFSVNPLKPVEQVTAVRKTTYPYIPGLLSFREIPAILDAWNMLQLKPDLCLCDGQGIAHPRRFGVACHFGVLTRTPSIGVGKSRLIGEHKQPGIKRGCREVLQHRDGIIGTVVRTRENVKPLYISPGHLISIQSAVDWVLNLTTCYKLPEPVRAADKLASGRT